MTTFFTLILNFPLCITLHFQCLYLSVLEQKSGELRHKSQMNWKLEGFLYTLGVKSFQKYLHLLFYLHRKLKVYKIFKSILRSKKIIYYDDIPKKVWPHFDVCSVVGQVLYYNCLGSRYNISRQLLAGVNSKNFWFLFLRPVSFSRVLTPFNPFVYVSSGGGLIGF